VTSSRNISRDSRSGILVGIGATLALAPVAAGLSLAALVGAGAVALTTAAVTRFSAPAAAQDFLS